MVESRAAYRYALALIGLAEEMKQLDDVSKDIHDLERLIRSSRELVLFFKSPVITREKKKTVLTELFKGKVSEVMFQFIKLLAAKDREALLPEIIVQYNKLLDQKRGIIPVIVRTASSFSKEQERQLVERLQAMTKKTPRIEFVQDASLIGGFAVQYDDTVWDGSVRHQLEVLKKRLVHGTS
jgi:F-type H+-transporting ATPase subunit delta